MTCVQDVTFRGVSTCDKCARRYFQHVFLKTAVLTVSFSNVRISVPDNATTLWEHFLEREFYALKHGMHNSKFVFPTKWDLFLENNLYTTF